MSDPKDPTRQPLHELEHDLHGVVAFVILPIFAFVNAGVSFAGVTVDDLLHPVPLGIAAGLFLGKQLGVFGFCFMAIKLGLARLPEGASWWNLYGVSVLAGVGFTMSLFVGSLAFEGSNMDVEIIFDERLGILLGSFLSAVLGMIVLSRSLPKSD
jgi:NhaA family Na+:H+ antiporter